MSLRKAAASRQTGIQLTACIDDTSRTRLGQIRLSFPVIPADLLRTVGCLHLCLRRIHIFHDLTAQLLIHRPHTDRDYLSVLHMRHLNILQTTLRFRLYIIGRCLCIPDCYVHLSVHIITQPCRRDMLEHIQSHTEPLCHDIRKPAHVLQSERLCRLIIHIERRQIRILRHLFRQIIYCLILRHFGRRSLRFRRQLRLYCHLLPSL